MTKCTPFAAKVAIIIHQDDYSLTKLIYDTFDDLPATANDAVNATHIAHGFGIADKDILYFENTVIKKMNAKIDQVKREFRDLARQGKPTFLFVYGAGHGVSGQRQFMVLNGTSGNLYPIEQTCRDFCIITMNYCKVFAVYDMCKDELKNYEKLTLRVARKKKEDIKKGRGEGEKIEGSCYWSIAGADSLGVVDADSVLALELLEAFNNYAKKNRSVSLPDVAKDFPFGILGSALGAPSFEIEWVSSSIFHSHTFNLAPRAHQS